MRDRVTTKVINSLYRKMNTTFTAGEKNSGPIDFSNRELALYIHFPFCDTICRYCPFSRTANQDDMRAYLTALTSELTTLRENEKLRNSRITSLAFGGGTPSLIPGKELRQLMEQLRQTFPGFDSIQKTMECTPESITPERLQLFEEVGINRLSIGVQSLCDPVLSELGRGRADSIREKLQLLKEWRDHWSADLIYGFESHTEEELLANISELISNGASHLSLFPLVNNDEGNELTPPQFRRLFSLFARAADLLKDQGFTAYSIEDYAKFPEAELLYQKDVWGYPQKDLLILGSGAFGISGAVQYRKSKNRKEYLREAEKGLFPLDRYLPIESSREALVRPLMGLHYNTIPLQRTPLFTLLKWVGILRQRENELTLTERGRFITSLLWAKIMVDRMNS